MIICFAREKFLIHSINPCFIKLIDISNENHLVNYRVTKKIFLGMYNVRVERDAEERHFAMHRKY